MDVDPAVLERARSGDHTAFRALVGHYDRGLRALAYRLLEDRGRMDDVLQEAYTKAYRGLGSFRGEASPGTWLYRITYNACMDERRRRRTIATVAMDTLSTRPGGEPGPAERAVLRVGLAGALVALPLDQRTAVLLVDGEGFDYEEAAGIMGVAKGTVASRVHRARTALRRQLSGSGRSNDDRRP